MKIDKSKLSCHQKEFNLPSFLNNHFFADESKENYDFINIKVEDFGRLTSTIGIIIRL